jgi:hypothetical protein
MRAMREQLTIKTAVLTAAPVSSHPSRRLGTSVSTAGSVRRRPAKRVVGDGQVTPHRRRFTRWWFGEPWPAGLVSPEMRRCYINAGSTQIWMLLVASVVVTHPLRIAHYGRVVTGNLEGLGERMGPLR